jgi:deoxyadenosine/deoxycytidine kinase
MLIKVVGVCGSGKSTLVKRLRALGFEARQVSQEHSYVPDLWSRFGREPSVLVYLEASLETVQRRLNKKSFTRWMYEEQKERLAHARSHADIVVQTDGLTPDEVAAEVVRELSG